MKHKLERKKAWRRKINFFTGKRREDDGDEFNHNDWHDDDGVDNISQFELIKHEEPSTIFIWNIVLELEHVMFNYIMYTAEWSF